VIVFAVSLYLYVTGQTFMKESVQLGIC